MLVDYPETSAPLTGFWRGHKVAQAWNLQRLGDFLPWWSSAPFVLLLRVQSDSGSQTFRPSAEHLGLNPLWVFQGAPTCACGYMSICTGPLGSGTISMSFLLPLSTSGATLLELPFIATFTNYKLSLGTCLIFLTLQLPFARLRVVLQSLLPWVIQHFVVM